MRRLRQRGLAAAILLVLAAGCTPAPPNLSPQAVSAFNNTRVIKALDLLRDTAVEAEKQQPQVLSTAATRQVVEAHKSALLVIRAADSGWGPTVIVLLDRLLATLPAADRPTVEPYVTLAKTVVTEVTR